MTWWRLRDPGSFPYEFHQAILAGEGTDKLIKRYYSERTLKGVKREWKCFMWSLKVHSTHPSGRAWAELDHRTKFVWSHEWKMWEFLLTSKRKVFADMISMH